MFFEIACYVVTIIAVLAVYGDRPSAAPVIEDPAPVDDIDALFSDSDPASDPELGDAIAAAIEIHLGITSDPVEPDPDESAYVELAIAANAEFWQSVSTDDVVPFKRRCDGDTENLAGLTIRQLKKLASDRHVKGYCNMRKAALVAALS